jgi:tetratricopeptide (TPR) repeat protein
LAFRAGRLAEAVEACQRGIERAHRQGEEDECWRLRILLSQCVCFKGDFAGSIALLEASPVGEGVSAETRGRILNQKAFNLSRSGNFVAAKAALDEASELAAACGSPQLSAEIEINRSTLCFYLAKYDEVGICAHAALQIGEEQNLPLIKASACAAMGKSAMYRGHPAEALPWFERALAIYEDEGAIFYAHIMRSEVGCCHFALQEYDQAEGHFVHALEASRASGALASLHIDLANMGCLHLSRGEFGPAISYFQQAVQIARNLGDAISVAKWLQNLALTYSRMGNPVLAKSYQLEAERVSQHVHAARAAAK